MWSRRGVLAGAGLAVAAGTTARALAGGSVSALSNPDFTFVSMPDFLNADVADVSKLPGFDGGMNSYNQWWQLAIDTCLRAVSAHQPDAVFIAGDQVEGRWNVDSDGRAVFGPVSQGTDEASLALCRSAISKAGAAYYGNYTKLFADRGLKIYPAVGDHELLDDRSGPLNKRWPSSGVMHGQPDNRWHLVPHCKEVWADHFTRTAKGAPKHRRRPKGTPYEFTAYSESFNDTLTLVTVDTFDRTSRGVQLGVLGEQLAWARREIKRARRRGHTVIVQGHVPAVGPYRTFATGNLHMQGPRSVKFWNALKQTGADFYFCGEVHDTTVVQPQSKQPVQISHGCTYRYGFSYLVGRVWKDRHVQLEYVEMPQIAQSSELGLWCSDRAKRAPSRISYTVPAIRGRLEWADGVVTSATDKLGAYDPQNDTAGWQKPVAVPLAKLRGKPTVS
ncbi:metallophosphoesterase [Nocardioides acrostichi]|uniref:Metallophosphoesterase n=1 Tax=Nocardioides acrostichi TaxID=2784339 RepID=A0A930UT60_9ACTN|nr:metallophosphoesterase [Nocardioides acrostichi]MBF4160383.1 metallophosphoesterase [Nocardioides acrostichi]